MDEDHLMYYTFSWYLIVFRRSGSSLRFPLNVLFGRIYQPFCFSVSAEKTYNDDILLTGISLDIYPLKKKKSGRSI